MSVSVVLSGGILTVLSTDKVFYSPGEPVRMSIFKLNISSQPLTLTYPTTQRYDFSVSGMTGEIWRWSHDKVFAQVVEQVVLIPGQSLSYSEIWPQVDVNGLRVRPGIYLVTGWNTFVGFERFPRPVTFIRIGI